MNAVIKEMIRWHNSTPLSLPHCTLEDDELHGYFIPAGTVLFGNTWCVVFNLCWRRAHCFRCADPGMTARIGLGRACMHDPEVYPDPDVFRPERFICDGKLDLSVRDPSKFVFGFGRR